MKEVSSLVIEELKQHVRLELIYTNGDILSQIPHINIPNFKMSVIPTLQIDEEDSLVISFNLCSRIGVTGDEILLYGRQNLQQVVYVPGHRRNN